MVYFNSTLQKCVTLSSIEAEYVELLGSEKVIIWLRRILKEIGINQKSLVIMQDNTSAMKWAAGHPTEDFCRSKHMELRYHHIREIIQSGELSLQKINTGQMAPDCLTKLLNAQKYKETNDQLQLADIKTIAKAE